jgi:type IV pilus assembly protein PilY1
MNTARTLRMAALLCLGGTLGAPALADDIDIFLGASGGSGDAPNVIFLLDNGPNWSRQAQGWTDPTTGAKITQGVAELNALQQVLTYLASQNQPINVGLAMLTPFQNGNSTGGGYIRFAARDMTVTSNRVALQNILANIEPCVGGCGQANESLSGMSHKDETAALYEIYKYYSGLAPYTGGPNSINNWDDTAGNLGGGSLGSSGLTAYAQGLGSGWAIAGGAYQSPISASKPCASNYIIYIANNSNGQIGSTENVYEPNVVPALIALPATPTDTWTDEWTRFLYQSGAVVPAGNSNGSIVTYILDAYNAQNNAGYSGSLQAAAVQGGGRYYQVGTQVAVYNALVRILEQIQAVNSTFASASLPVNATNRAEDQNQVFVPMFRPDATIQPRWFGNLKEYQLINSNGSIQLGDARGQPAVNLLTGFPTACARSFWTTGDADPTHYPNGYWDFGQSENAADMWNMTNEAVTAKGTCPTTSHWPLWDDTPDGPAVEKGGVAEVIRKGNNPSITNGSPTWSPSRNVLTINAQGGAWSNTSLLTFSTASTGLPASLVNWMLGQDVQDENGNGNTAESRPSLHGDEIHSRPLPIDYGSAIVPVVVFYGSNDGTLRAVDAGSGRELWAFVPPEFYNPTPAVYTPGASPVTTPTGLERLMWSNMTDAAGNQVSPIIKYFGTPPGVTPTPVPKDYYYDGSTGLYESAVNAQGVPGSVWIYPTMRRGGRMLYGLDVTNSATPAVLWKFGCPYLTSDTACLGGADASSIGQTWSTPAVAASVVGYNSPVVIVGGGYDGCEDNNTPNPSTTVNPATGSDYCPSPQKGAGVYVLDAKKGTELAFFPTAGSVAADVALISVATPGVVDHAYAADTRGNIYRLDFAGNQNQWVMRRIAYTNGSGRKFLFAPALLAAPGGQVYVALGSGDREHPLQAQYPYMNVVNRFYVFKDNLASVGALNLDDTTKMDDFTYSSGDPGPHSATTGTSCATSGVLPTSTMSGWFMNLSQNGQGEQTVTSAIIAAGMVAFSTNRPIPQTQGSCATVLGAAYGYWVNLFNASGGIGATGAACGGTRDVPFVGGGLPPSPVIASVPVDGQVVQTVIGAAQLSGGTSCGICPQQVKPAIVPTRKTIFWKGSGEN